MNNNQKLETFAIREYRRHAHNIIVETDQDQHLVFGAYVLEHTVQGVKVWNRAHDIIAIFQDRRAALSYCVADKFRQYALGSKIIELDQQKQHYTNDISMYRVRIARSRNSEFIDLVNNKLSQRRAQLKAVIEQLEKCINQAKYLQIKGFQNETARVF